MYKVVKKNKTYKKRKLIIYDDNDKKIAEVTPWRDWFCMSNCPNRFYENFSLVRMEVLKNLYWLIGQDCDEEEWERSIERWDTGKGVIGAVTNESQFFNENEKLASIMSFKN